MKLFNLVVTAASLFATGASAESVGYCGPDHAPGDYVETPNGRQYCETSWTGAWKLIPWVIGAMSSLYEMVTQYDSLWVIGIGFALGWYGGRLTGSRAHVTGTVRNGILDGTWHPPVEGKAKTFAGRLTGGFMQGGAFVLIVMGIVSCVNGH